jgi:quercetin dioxygenase-like cupin family protein
MIYKKNNEGFRSPLEGVSYKTLVHGDKTSLSLFRLEKGAEIPPHSHPHEQTGYMVEGKMVFRVGEEEFIAEPGDSWSIPGGVEHSVSTLEDCLVVEVFSPVREDYL